MINLKDFYAKYCENNVNESEDLFDINYNDSGITKVIKKFLNWFLGSTEKDSYNPYSEKWNEDGTKEKLKELKTDGEKIDIEIKDIPSIEEFRTAINKANGFLNLKKLISDKSSIKKYKSYKFGAVSCNVKNMCNDLPVIYFMYQYSKNSVKIQEIEAINSYAESIQPKNFISKLKSFIKGELKSDKLELKKYSIRFTRLHAKAGWSYEKLLEYVANDRSFTRDSDSEQDKNIERIYTSKL